MRKVLILHFIIFQVAAYAQNHELQLLYKFGFSTRNLSVVNPNSEVFAHDFDFVRTPRCQFDQSANLSYKYSVWKQRKLFLIGGIDISQTKYYFPLIDGENRHLGNIDIRNNKWSYNLGLNKEFYFYDSKLVLELGIVFKDVYPFNKTVKLNSDYTLASREWIEYKYDFDAYFRQNFPNNGSNRGYHLANIRTEYSLGLKFKLYNSFYLSANLSYQRNNYFYYNYSWQAQYYYNNSASPNGWYSFQGFQDTDTKFFVNDDFLYLSIGASYKF
jgi:hypothetical protein